MKQFFNEKYAGKFSGTTEVIPRAVDSQIQISAKDGIMTPRVLEPRSEKRAIPLLITAGLMAFSALSAAGDSAFTAADLGNKTETTFITQTPKTTPVEIEKPGLTRVTVYQTPATGVQPAKPSTATAAAEPAKPSTKLFPILSGIAAAIAALVALVSVAIRRINRVRMISQLVRGIKDQGAPFDAAKTDFLISNLLASVSESQEKIDILSGVVRSLERSRKALSSSAFFTDAIDHINTWSRLVLASEQTEKAEPFSNRIDDVQTSIYRQFGFEPSTQSRVQIGDVVMAEKGGEYFVMVYQGPSHDEQSADQPVYAQRKIGSDRYAALPFEAPVNHIGDLTGFNFIRVFTPATRSESRGFGAWLYDLVIGIRDSQRIENVRVHLIALSKISREVFTATEIQRIVELALAGVTSEKRKAAIVSHMIRKLNKDMAGMDFTVRVKLIRDVAVPTLLKMQKRFEIWAAVRRSLEQTAAKGSGQENIETLLRNQFTSNGLPQVHDVNFVEGDVLRVQFINSPSTTQFLLVLINDQGGRTFQMMEMDPENTRLLAKGVPQNLSDAGFDKVFHVVAKFRQLQAPAIAERAETRLTPATVVSAIGIVLSALALTLGIPGIAVLPAIVAVFAVPVLIFSLLSLLQASGKLTFIQPLSIPLFWGGFMLMFVVATSLAAGPVTYIIVSAIGGIISVLLATLLVPRTGQRAGVRVDIEKWMDREIPALKASSLSDKEEARDHLELLAAQLRMLNDDGLLTKADTRTYIRLAAGHVEQLRTLSADGSDAAMITSKLDSLSTILESASKFLAPGKASAPQKVLLGQEYLPPSDPRVQAAVKRFDIAIGVNALLTIALFFVVPPILLVAFPVLLTLITLRLHTSGFLKVSRKHTLPVVLGISLITMMVVMASSILGTEIVGSMQSASNFPVMMMSPDGSPTFMMSPDLMQAKPWFYISPSLLPSIILSSVLGFLNGLGTLRSTDRARRLKDEGREEILADAIKQVEQLEKSFDPDSEAMPVQWLRAISDRLRLAASGMLGISLINFQPNGPAEESAWLVEAAHHAESLRDLLQATPADRQGLKSGTKLTAQELDQALESLQTAIRAARSTIEWKNYLDHLPVLQEAERVGSPGLADVLKRGNPKTIEAAVAQVARAAKTDPSLNNAMQLALRKAALVQLGVVSDGPDGTRICNGIAGDNKNMDTATLEQVTAAVDTYLLQLAGYKFEGRGIENFLRLEDENHTKLLTTQSVTEARRLVEVLRAAAIAERSEKRTITTAAAIAAAATISTAAAGVTVSNSTITPTVPGKASVGFFVLNDGATTTSVTCRLEKSLTMQAGSWTPVFSIIGVELPSQTATFIPFDDVPTTGARGFFRVVVEEPTKAKTAAAPAKTTATGAAVPQAVPTVYGLPVTGKQWPVNIPGEITGPILLNGKVATATTTLDGKTATYAVDLNKGTVTTRNEKRTFTAQFLDAASTTLRDALADPKTIGRRDWTLTQMLALIDASVLEAEGFSVKDLAYWLTGDKDFNPEASLKMAHKINPFVTALKWVSSFLNHDYNFSADITGFISTTEGKAFVERTQAIARAENRDGSLLLPVTGLKNDHPLYTYYNFEDPQERAVIEALLAASQGFDHVRVLSVNTAEAQWLQKAQSLGISPVEVRQVNVDQLAINNDRLGRTLEVTRTDPQTGRKSTMNVPAGSFYSVPDYVENRIFPAKGQETAVVRQVFAWRKAQIDQFGQTYAGVPADRQWRIATTTGSSAGIVKTKNAVADLIAQGIIVYLPNEQVGQQLRLIGETAEKFIQRIGRNEVRTDLKLRDPVYFGSSLEHEITVMEVNPRSAHLQISYKMGAQERTSYVTVAEDDEIFAAREDQQISLGTVVAIDANTNTVGVEFRSEKREFTADVRALQADVDALKADANVPKSLNPQIFPTQKQGTPGLRFYLATKTGKTVRVDVDYAAGIRFDATRGVLILSSGSSALGGEVVEDEVPLTLDVDVTVPLSLAEVQALVKAKETGTLETDKTWASVRTRQALQDEVGKLLSPEVLAWYGNTHFTFRTGVLADVFWGIIVRAEGISPKEAQAVADVMTKFYEAKTAKEFNLSRFLEAVQPILAEHPIFAVSATPGKLIEDFSKDLSDDEWAQLGLDMMMNSGQELAAVMDKKAPTKEQAAITEKFNAIKKMTDVEGKLIGTRMGLKKVKDVARGLVAEANKAEGITPTMRITSEEALKEVLGMKDKCFANILFSKASRNAGLSAMQRKAAMAASQKNPSAITAGMEISAELTKAWPDVFTLVGKVQRYIQVNNGPLAGMIKTLTELLTASRSTSVAA